ncbi:MAG: DUF1080 domain-containing protein [Planctomycetota bacterium]|nr:MAG: DUF1080 domain-containing protein [Planctomycetota bacterium]
MDVTRHSAVRGVLALAVLPCLAAGAAVSLMGPGQDDVVPDTVPRVVDPGAPGVPPSDAVVLFDGTDLSQWSADKGGDAQWKVSGGVMEVNGTGSIVTKRTFGDQQVHVEFATPAEVAGEGQGRGNSGVYIQGRYEVQVLDSYGSATYPNGQCGAVYGLAPPLVNACRPPGEWQTYDIVFRAARAGADGGSVQPATITVFHNGVLVQDHFVIEKSTTASMPAGGREDGPLYLQDHGNPVRYRNVWIRPLD